MLDDCTCDCSENGCSPAVILFRVIEGHRAWVRPPRWLEIVCGLLTEAVEPEQQAWEWLPIKAIRFMIFSWIGLTHTCRRQFETDFEGYFEELPEDEILRFKMKSGL